MRHYDGPAHGEMCVVEEGTSWSRGAALAGRTGQRIYENVSQEAWNLWVDRLRILINEYRLSPARKEHQEIIAQQMEQFFFGGGTVLPPSYVPEKK